MNDEDYLSLKLQEGEGYRVEFKEKLANLDREIIAFANAIGGEIFLGVDDAGKVKGIDIDNKLLSQIQDIARNCDPSININFKKHKTHNVLAVIIAEGVNKPYKCKDGFFLRIGPNSQKLKRDEIVQFINDVGKLHFDEAVNQRFQYPNDFSEAALKQYLKQCNLEVNSSAEDILISLNLSNQTPNTFQVTNAGVLFFAKNPQHFFPEAYITAIRYKSNDRYSILDKKDFMGSPISQIDESLAFVIRHMNVTPQFGKTNISQHEDIYDYPPIAIREAIINAITHRDYLYDGSHVYIHMYPDHIDIESPGGLYHGLSIEDLGKRSVRRNRMIADLLHRARYIERVGSGFDRMRNALHQNHNPELVVTANNFFNIRFFKRKQDFNLQKLSARQLALYHRFLERKVLTKKDVVVALHVSNDTALRELNVLMQHHLITKQGVGKNISYILRSM
jgi:ATP-dependent DNA helicase RecG